MLFGLWGICRKAVVWFGAGFADGMAYRTKGTKIDIGKCVAAKIDNCQPWTDHLEVSTISGIDDAIKNKDFNAARGLLAFGAVPTASKHCLHLLELGIELLAEGEEAILELWLLE